jgi:hypothetical protein
MLHVQDSIIEMNNAVAVPNMIEELVLLPWRNSNLRK